MDAQCIHVNVNLLDRMNLLSICLCNRCTVKLFIFKRNIRFFPTKQPATVFINLTILGITVPVRLEKHVFFCDRFS